MYPLPRTDELIEDIARNERYTALDLLSGYHQFPMNEADIPKTAFTSKFGNFEYTVMPFGLCNAPATCQRAMENILHDEIRSKRAGVYLDDVCIVSKSAETHEEDVLQVCRVMNAYNLKVKASKCQFDKKKLHFLGHIISKKGIVTDPEKCTAIRNWGTPTNLKQLQSFLGLANYYRKFIPDYAETAAPLYKLLKKGVVF